ncbi:MAG: chromate transporter [Treponemataceae bacterium]|nr:MAG: chromate transporter [Treponemataceae bacterium]
MPTVKQMLRDCAALFNVFFKIGCVAFGGGYAALPMLERELVAKRGWATQEILYDYYAIGQCTPGIILVNVATFVGYTQAGVLGSVAATAGIVMPSLIIISLIASFVQNFAHILVVQKALSGINVAVAALLTKAMWDFGKKSVSGIITFALFALSFAAMAFFRVNSVIVILAGAGAGLIMHAVKNARRDKGAGDGTH